MPEEGPREPEEDRQHRHEPEGWEAATQYHRLKRQLPPALRVEVRERAVRAILERAQALTRHARRPTRAVDDAWPAEGELDLDGTLEQPRPWRPADLRLHRVEPRQADVVAVLDMSLSMTGPKVALVALATAILHLRLDSLAVVHFDTRARTLLRLGETVPPEELVRRVLEVPAQGYTNIEAGLLRAERELQRATHRERVVILLSDGIANMGGDPARVAARLPRLHLVQVGGEEKIGTESCRRMAQAGRGRLWRAPRYEDLPEVVHGLVREVFR